MPVPVDTLVTPEMASYMRYSLHDLGLNIKIVAALENDRKVPDKYGSVHHIRTIGQLLQASPEQLLAINNFGAKMLEEIYTRLSALGFVKPGYEQRGMLLADQANQRTAKLNWLKRRLGYLTDLDPYFRS